MFIDLKGYVYRRREIPVDREYERRSGQIED